MPNQDETIIGTANDEPLDGGNGSDTIAGEAGDDALIGGNGHDVIDGGTGNDVLDGGNGKDTLDGGAGDDTLDGGNGKDTLDGGAGSDLVDGGNGNDLLVYRTNGNAGATDVYSGAQGVDTIRIVVTSAQYQNPLFLQELAAYQQFLVDNSDASTTDGPSFTFSSLDLSLSNFEEIEVVVDDAQNTAPTASDDAGSVTEDAVQDTIGGNVLDNDTEPDALDILTVSAVAGAAANVGAAIVGTYGTLVLNADGTWSYVLDNGLPAVQALAEGVEVTETFAYVVTDGTDDAAAASSSPSPARTTPRPSPPASLPRPRTARRWMSIFRRSATTSTAKTTAPPTAMRSPGHRPRAPPRSRAPR